MQEIVYVVKYTKLIYTIIPNLLTFHTTMSLRLLPIIIILITAAAIASTPSAFSNNVTDEHALLAVKASITGDPLGVLTSWNHSIHFCQWNGITCSRRHQRVTELRLSSQQLQGTLSPHIGNLTFLQALYLNTNSFHGSIPSEIGQLFRLRYLNLTSNTFQGTFPDNLTGWFDIRNISLKSNNLEGKLPSHQFASWSKLTSFIFSNNYFTGSIPPSVGNLSSLKILDLTSNNLEGSIPLEAGQLLKLEYIALNFNNLSGMVPLSLYNISSISVISIVNNQFEGSLPPDMGLTLPNLQLFFAGNNKLSGPFPISIGNTSNLVKFDIALNNIIGPLQINFGRLFDLEEFNVDANQLGHNQPSGELSFLNSLVNCTRLYSLGLAENGLRGELPNSILNISTTIQDLSLFENYIHGSIPQEIGKFVNLIYLELSDNKLTGSIPESIGQLSKLGQLYLYGNNLSGEIPASVSNITGLLHLILYNNMLQGSIPIALFNISTLLALELSNNSLSGLIPEQVSGLSSLSFVLGLSQNLFTGRLPSTIGSLKHLVSLSISDNQFTGEIPNTLGDCSMLEELHMDGNFFEGTIPSSFKALGSLVYLDLSNNTLSGSIPSFLGKFQLLQNLNLSNNRLEGEVPKQGVFLNVSAFSIVGNSQICGGIRALRLPACHVKISKTQKNKASSGIISLAVLLPFAILLAFVSLFFYHKKKTGQKKNVPLSPSQDDRYPRVSYQELLQATSEFSQNNLLGKGRYGSVYKGVSESLQQTVAVKVLNTEVRGANNSFLAECETMRNIRHRNLIQIITVCSCTDYKGNDFKALLFDLMTNGSLHNWLHPSPSDQGEERSLTLLQRLNISIDVAMAVDYLHHHSHARIIHCDIKPSNILLDEDFVARVGDFGLARFFLNTDGEINQAGPSTTGVRGTVGYVPPEYGMGGEISAEGDVYSYGITLLELFTGKRPTDTGFPMVNANNIHDYVRNALPTRVMSIADPLIIIQHKDNDSKANQSYRDTVEVCLERIFEVGILCSVETPKERIDISVALKQLHVARDLLRGYRQ